MQGSFQTKVKDTQVSNANGGSELMKNGMAERLQL